MNTKYVRQQAAKIREELIKNQLNMNPKKKEKLKRQLWELQGEFSQAIRKDIGKLKELDAEFTRRQQIEQQPPFSMDYNKLEYLRQSLISRFNRMSSKELEAEFESVKNDPEALRVWKEHYPTLLASRGNVNMNSMTMHGFHALSEKIRGVKYREADPDSIGKALLEGMNELREAVTSMDTILSTEARDNVRYEQPSEETKNSRVWKHDPLYFRAELNKMMKVNTRDNLTEVTFEETPEAVTESGGEDD